MTALRVVETAAGPADPLAARVLALVDELGGVVADALGGVVDDASEADVVDQIAALERLRAAVAAAQSARMVAFARARTAREMAEQVHPRDVGAGVVEEIALACRVSPWLAGRRFGAARAWWFDLPATFAALAAGEVGEQTATVVASETSHLDAATRRDVDTRLAGRLAGLSRKEAEALARKVAYEADPEGYTRRGRTARHDRRVTLRPAPDTMSLLSGLLPVEQGVACLAALKRHTDSVIGTGDGRTRGQIMADTLVERLTGQARAEDVAFEIQLVVPTHPDTGENPYAGPGPGSGFDDRPGAGRTPSPTRPVVVTGIGPLPGPLAHDVVDASHGRRRARNIYTSPAGHLVDIDARTHPVTGRLADLTSQVRARARPATAARQPDAATANPFLRRFTGALADLIRARDQTCRETSCGAPIRHLDHIWPHRHGGPTTGPNGRGACARHNYVREHPGWTVRLANDGLSQDPDAPPHTVETTTPTGHTYRSRAPDPP